MASNQKVLFMNLEYESVVKKHIVLEFSNREALKDFSETSIQDSKRQGFHAKEQEQMNCNRQPSSPQINTEENILEKLKREKKTHARQGTMSLMWHLTQECEMSIYLQTFH